MTVEQQGGSRLKARRHRQGFGGVEPDHYEALPGGTVALGFGAQAAQEGLAEFHDLVDVHGGDEGMGGGGGASHDDIFEFVGAGREDGSSLAHFSRIEQIEHGEVLDGEDLVHAFKAQAALAIEEVRDVGLLESGLLGETEAGEFALFNAFPKNFSQIFLQDPELHLRSIASGCWSSGSGERLILQGLNGIKSKRSEGKWKGLLRAESFPQARMFAATLTEKIHKDRIAPQYALICSRDDANDQPLRQIE